MRDASHLVDAGLVSTESAAALEPVLRRFDLAITPQMTALIDQDDASDPIGRQFLPDRRELDILSEEQGDPIGDEACSPLKGIVHRYPDRVLLKPLHTCAVYCRFCFRRERVGRGGEMLSDTELDAALLYVRERPAIWEVIVTGGDPFVLSPRRLGRIVTALGEIPHLGVIRFHTRVPLVDPGRVTPELVAALGSDKAVYVAIHANHAREVTPEGRSALRLLSSAGIPLLGQTVLLRGVNDNAAVLMALFRTLVENRVKPYYLHHGDLARGTGHFRTTLEEGRRLVAALRGQVSGLCQPTYVLDLPGGAGKVAVAADCALQTANGTWRVTPTVRYRPFLSSRHPLRPGLNPPLTRRPGDRASVAREPRIRSG